VKKRIVIFTFCALSFVYNAFAEASYSEENVVYFKEKLELAELNGSDYAVLDIRANLNFNKEHIEDAISIPRMDLDARFHELDHLKSHIIFIYGYRTADARKAGEFLGENGFDEVVILVGGLSTWKDQGYIVVSRD
jgi:rhodanese-related sulfurtransferase